MPALLYRLVLCARVLEAVVLAPVWLVRSVVRDWLADAPSAILDVEAERRRFA